MRNRITKEPNSILDDYGHNFEGIGFVVYGDPVSKMRPRTVRNMDRYGQSHVHTYTPAKTKDHESKIALEYKANYGRYKFEKEVPLVVEINFFIRVPKSVGKKVREKMLSREILPTKKNGDLDNYIKCAVDGLNGVAYEDDSQIVEMIGRKFYSDEPRTEIFIMRMDGNGVR